MKPLIVERDQSGEWPDWAQDIVAFNRNEPPWRVLDLLARGRVCPTCGPDPRDMWGTRGDEVIHPCPDPMHDQIT